MRHYHQRTEAPDFNLDASPPGNYLLRHKVKMAGLGCQRDESEIILPTFLFP